MEIRIGRREMLETLTRGTLIATPVGLFLVSCGSSSSDNGNGAPSAGAPGAGASGADAPAAPPQKSGTQVVYTSSMVESHFHTFGVETPEFVMPDAAGVSGATSSAASHTHDVSISMAQLQSVGSGESVKVTTSSVAGHSHVLTFVNVS